jgi:hypothetical protein
MARSADEQFMAVINANLPNGLHDAVLQEMRVNFVDQSLEIRLDADVSLPDAPDGRARYVPCTLAIGGLWAFSCETLDGLGRSRFKGQWMDCGALEEDRRKTIGWSLLPDDVFGCRLFLNDLNAFIYFAGRQVQVALETH